MPRLADERGEQQPGRHDCHPDFDHEPRPPVVHQPADERAQHGRDQKPNENAPAVTLRPQPNSSRIGGKSSEKGVRALTPTPIVTKATATMTHP